jgi:nucleotide-binding universal stress UspA family protein
MPNISLILAPVDFSPGSESAAAYAFWLAGRLEARLRLLHVFIPVAQASAGVALGVRDDLVAADLELLRQVESALADLALRLEEQAVGTGAPVPESTVVQKGPESTGEAILKAALGAGADLIVMGTHGRGGLRRMILGSVAEEVVRIADCPVLTIRQVGTGP